MIEIQCSSRLLTEKKYIIDVIFTDFLGLPYQLITDELIFGFLITLDNGKHITLNAEFWESVDDNYLNEKSLPTVIMVKNKFTPESDIPLLFGHLQVDILTDSIICGNDIFGTCFFMLSRMEEAIIDERDEHGRFPAIASVAYKNDLLERPIVDEYVEMLWNMLAHLDPSLKRKDIQATNFITCDVDWPFEPNKYSLKKTILSSCAALIKRKQVSQFLLQWRLYFLKLLRINHLDKYSNAINWIMDENEGAGNKVAFYFITEYTSNYDSNFDFDSNEIRELFRDIHNRGHEIGLHPGYACFDDENHFVKSAETLQRVLEEENIVQPVIGGRMHFLRCDILKTLQLWERCGFDYDSTLSFADKSGFRCGTSREFTMFDLVNRKPLNLKQRPLINMECTIIDNKYEYMGYTKESLSRFKKFKVLTKRYGGRYTLLWHNSHFENESDKYFYKKLIK